MKSLGKDRKLWIGGLRAPSGPRPGPGWGPGDTPPEASEISHFLAPKND